METIDCQAVWDVLYPVISARISSPGFNKFFQESFASIDESGTFKISLNKGYNVFIDHIRENYLSLLSESLKECQQDLPSSIKGISIDALGKGEALFTAETQKEDKISLKPIIDKTRRRAVEAPKANDAKSKNNFPSSDRYSFQNFIVGDSNRLAFATSKAVSESPGFSYNPLFIYGSSGLGKSHLLHAIAQETMSHNPYHRIEYLSAEEFSNIFIDSIQHNDQRNFRKRFRNVDILLLDDVQFLKNKTKTQEEFFHTFNALYSLNKQIVLTSDCQPHELDGLEKRLVSRFEHGQIVDVLKPEFETRVAILRQKRNSMNVHIPNDVLDFIASNIKSHVRKLEGALVRLVTYASTMGYEVNASLAREVLGGQLENTSDRNLDITAILRQVAEYFDVGVKDILGKRRTQSIVTPRQVAMYLSRNLTEESFPAIAEQFRRTHATVLHSCNAINEQMELDPSFKDKVFYLKKRLENL
ncbi:chromosomal replication initiator protein DnaA [Lentisphaera profundi]|uniref:Chromosomal replication initiator protein DnaA n=1 Tax=Lentisphaera profundi TaxID=1658616 RepID=A0ABY7W1P3_9BACT|nr:chromosomal replication initiator protein DnaA [Lentisphaera profundi]WDE99027.1 chromosomal replication initiator protein DnaA [Lentisphaera profundi]